MSVSSVGSYCLENYLSRSLSHVHKALHSPLGSAGQFSLYLRRLFSFGCQHLQTTVSTIKRATSMEDYLFVKSLPENVATADLISFLNQTANGSVVDVSLNYLMRTWS